MGVSCNEDKLRALKEENQRLKNRIHSIDSNSKEEENSDLMYADNFEKENLKKDIILKQNTINKLEKELGKSKDIIENLNVKIKDLEQENKCLNNKNSLLEKENHNLKNENSSLKQNINSLQNQYNELLKNYNLIKNKEKNEIKKNNENKQFINNNFIDRYENIKMGDDKNISNLKKKVLNNQKQMRNELIVKNRNNGNVKNVKLNQVLEDMCIYGNIIKKEIKICSTNPKKYISTSDALKLENKDNGLFALGLLAHNLENEGIQTLIDLSEGKEGANEAATSLQFISNGLTQKKKYDLHFEFGQKRNDELLNNKYEYEKFKNKLKQKLSKDYNISSDEIIITFPQKGSFHVQVIFQSDEFNNLDLDKFKENFKNDKEFKELSNLKEIHTDVIMGACRLLKSQLDSRGNRVDGWGIGEKRGCKEYNPPLGWTGIGLKVMDEYGDNKWIGMKNIPGEWCVAYHGVGSGQSSDNVKNVTGLIYKGNFKKGSRQVHRNCLDQYHQGQKVGEGVYCTPNIKTAEGYAGISNINGKSYKTVLMVRVNPESIRSCTCTSDYWVVNGTNDEIRPYRILYKSQ